ncbi:MAG: hypothetical protein H6641_13160 [Caldilineaceae bacterium]|nr:hypothetical protein [Caldilineaceae bacterium]
MDFEEKYQDVLQNIEFAIISVYRERPEMVDYEVEKALNGLIELYTAEERNREPRPQRNIQDASLLVYERTKSMCEWRLGRPDVLEAEDGQGIPVPEPITLAEMIACLKRIRKSVERWTKRGGRQGYLNFVGEFLPG